MTKRSRPTFVGARLSGGREDRVSGDVGRRPSAFSRVRAAQEVKLRRPCWLRAHVPEEPGDRGERLDGLALVSSPGKVGIEVRGPLPDNERCRRLALVSWLHSPRTRHRFPKKVFVG